jgi:hypothetical protein
MRPILHHILKTRRAKEKHFEQNKWQLSHKRAFLVYFYKTECLKKVEGQKDKNNHCKGKETKKETKKGQVS